MCAGLLAWQRSVGPDSGCETLAILQDETSPSGAVTAIVRDSVCSDGWLTTAVIVTVELHDRRDPSRRTRILAVDTGGRVELQPRIAWQDGGGLVVEMTTLAGATLLPHGFPTVGVDVRIAPPRIGGAAGTRGSGLVP